MQFMNTGVDYFGPILVKRDRGTDNRYGCIFTCLAVQAVHIAVAHSLSTDAFFPAPSRDLYLEEVLETSLQ